MTIAPANSGKPVLLQARGLVKYFPVRRGLFNRVHGQVRAVDGAVSYTHLTLPTKRIV